MRYLIALLLLAGCSGSETSSETTVLCTTNITQQVLPKNQVAEIPAAEIPLAENQEIISVEELPSGDEIVTTATYTFAATVEQCNNNGGVSNSDELDRDVEIGS